MKSLRFEEKLAWLEWAQRQVAAKYGWNVARSGDDNLIDPPRFEVTHLRFIQQSSRTQP